MNGTEELTGSFTTTFLVEQKPEAVYQAITRVADWWQGEITGHSENLNDEFEYRMPDIHYSKQKVVEAVPGKRLVWLVTKSNLSSFSDKQEWNGTKIIFEISRVGDKTGVRFTHLGLVRRFQCYGDCSGAWDALVNQSLFSLITTGKGKKVF
ncbi:MAG TPA: SRPBCC domain-containing protein [Cyclobacteriaceae bacterium]|nr:SRPBCC domain-containing protein [Cyclobacteriaceae bacterium]